MITRLKSTDFTSATISAITGPTITSVQIASDNTYGTLLDDTAVSTLGGYIIVNGTGFVSGCQVYIDSTISTSVTFVNSTRVNVQVPASSSGTYVIYLINPDGSMAIRINGITYSVFPAWSTGSNLPDLTVPVLLALSATSDSNITYSLAEGSSLPPGLSLSSSGTLSGTWTGSATTTYNFTVIATDAELQNTSRTFSVTVVINDTYFPNTSLLLGGTNSTNTWINDNSSNKFALTVNGDTRPTAFSPYKTVWSNRFDGTGDYLTLPSSSAFSFGTGDFTVEGWYYLNAGVTRFCLYDSGGGGTNGQLGIFQDSATGFLVRMSTDITYASPPGTNQWTHFAVTRSGTTVRLFFNGSLATSGTQATDITNTTPYIGVLNGFAASGFIMNGYISNLRVVKGTALYTGAFTPSTTPLTAVAGTSLLTCQSNRLIDNSTNNFTITKNGDTTVSAFGPFTETDTTTGSAYFDGTGDWLSLTSQANLALSTTDFTIEFWVYIALNAIPANITLYDQRNGTNGLSVVQPVIELTSGTGYAWYVEAVNKITSGNSVVRLNGWQHIAVTRFGTTTRMFVDGVQAGSSFTTDTYNYPAGSLTIGRANDGVSTRNHTGYISNLRVVKGTALYTSTFTPSASPLLVVSNTALLTLQYRLGENNNRFIDGSGNNFVVSRFGNTTQGTFTPFSQTGWSSYFNRTNYQNIQVASSADFNMGSGAGNFTIEFWVNFNSLPGGSNFHWILQGNNQGGIFLFGASPNIYWRNAADQDLATNVNAGITTGVWYHFAFVRSSSTYSIYKDGALLTSGTGTPSASANQQLFIGTTNSYNGGLDGYISNFRFTRSAVYTSAFTVTTSPLTTTSQSVSSSDVKLLTLQSNRFVDNSTQNTKTILFGDNGSNLGTRSVQAFSPFAPTAAYDSAVVGGSAYFDGTGDYLDLPSNAAFTIGTSDFTLEGYLYLISGTTGTLYDSRTSAASISPVIYLNAGVLTYFVGTNVITGPTIIVGQWYHIAVARSGTSTIMFVNGVQVGSTYTDTNNYVIGGPKVGAGYNNTNLLNGYISSLRLVRGTVLYTATFTPPASSLTAITNTQLLLNFTNAGIYDSTGKNNLETVNNAIITNAQAKWDVGSLYFDGTDDYLTMPTNPNLDFGTGDFTIELWVYFSALTSSRLLLDRWASGNANSWQLYWRSAGTSMTFLVGASTVLLQDSNASRIATGQWYHIAVTRSGTTNRMFIDGTVVATATDSTSLSSTLPLGVGIQTSTSTNDFNGYMTDIRITKGIARYSTSTFTAPGSAFLTR